MSRPLLLTSSPAIAPAQQRIQRSCSCGGCDKCKKRKLQRAPLAAQNTPAQPGLSAPSLDSGGTPLSPLQRARLEPLFRTSFANVRVHDDAASHQAAKTLHANAFTWGQHIHFGAGRFAPQSRAGLHLLAHELTHTVQQRGDAPVAALQSIEVDAPNTVLERQAEASADAIVTGHAVDVRPAASTVVQRQAAAGAVGVQAPASPPGCSLPQHRAIEPAVHGAQEELRLASERLGAFLRAPADRANQAVREALDRHFHSTAPAIATRVQARVQRIRNDMLARRDLTVECHDASDTSCGGAGAYVLDSRLLVFCPSFFANSPAWQIGALTHEMAHALTGLDHAEDRAYIHNRALPNLSTAEALNNAESYTMFVHEVATGQAVLGTAPADTVEDCNARTQPLVRVALGHLEHWNTQSESITRDERQVMLNDNAPLFTAHLGDSLPATRAAARTLFGNVEQRLYSPIDVRCDDRSTGECGAARHAYKGSSRQTGQGARSGAITGGVVGGLIGLGGAVGAVLGGASLLLGAGILGIGLAVGAALGAVIGLISGALTRKDEVHVCPTWASLPTAEDRAESLLAAIYETYGALDARAARRYAALARALYQRYTPPPPPI